MGYLPRDTLSLDAWLANFVAYVVLNQVLLGLTVQEVSDIVAALTEWQLKLAAHQAAELAAASAVDDKDTAKADILALVHPMVAKLQATASVTDGMREAMAITVRDGTLTTLSPDYVAQLTAPIVLLNAANRGQMSVAFGSNPANEHENAKPKYIRGAEIYFAQNGIPGSDPEAGPWEYAGQDTNSPYVHYGPMATSGTIAYRARWIDRLGRPGSFGEIVTISYTAQ